MSDSSSSPDDLLTAREVMELLGIARMTLERRMKAGRITPVNLNPALDRPKFLLFRRADAEALLHEHDAKSDR